MSGRRIALLLFLAWEAWWAWDFVAAPRPDYEMRTVFALYMGVFLPLLIAVPTALILYLRRRKL